MKTLKRLIVGALFAVTVMFIVACHTVQQVDPATGFTNNVTVVDQQKLDIIRQSMNTIGSAVFSAAIRNSPNHAAEIGSYVRAIGTTFCNVQATGRFSPATLFPALEIATAQQQANVPPEIIVAKNGIKTLYQILFNDKLTVTVPENKWPAAVCDVICSACDQALRDAGQVGAK